MTSSTQTTTSHPSRGHPSQRPFPRSLFSLRPPAISRNLLRSRAAAYLLASTAATIALLGAFGFANRNSEYLLAGAGGEDLITARVRRASMPITISAGGELESGKPVEIFCNVESDELKIIEMLPEGSQVEQGEVVLWLDPSEIKDRLAEQQITVTQVNAAVRATQDELKIQGNLAQSQVAQAELALELAELDKEKYLEGDYRVELNDLRGSIALAEAALQDATDTLEYYRTLVKKGFRTPEQMRAKEQEVKQAEYLLDRDQEKLQVLENFTLKRQRVELTAKATEAKRELERVKSSTAAAVSQARTDLEVAEATAQLEREQLRRIEEQLDQCAVRSTASGTLVYANDRNRRIEPGAIVHYKQKLFSVPDMNRMQVQAYVHESEVKKLQSGMVAEVRVDAFPSLVLHGKVQKVNNFYDATRHWLSGGVKEYITIISIEDLPDDSTLKPGMTAQARVLVGQVQDQLIVPIPAVVQDDEVSFCYVRSEQGLEKRKVVLGANTENYVEISDGLREGEQVALDARYRATTEPDS